MGDVVYSNSTMNIYTHAVTNKNIERSRKLWK